MTKSQFKQNASNILGITAIGSGAILTITGVISFFIGNNIGAVVENTIPLNYICNELDKLSIVTKCGLGAGLLYCGDNILFPKNELNS